MLGYILKITVGGIVLLAILTTIQALIPTTLTTTVNNAIIYLLETINNLNVFVNVSTIFDIILAETAFIIGVATFLFLRMLYHMLGLHNS